MPASPDPAAGPTGSDPAAGVAHLRAADPVMAEIIDEVGLERVDERLSTRRSADHYGALVRAIVGQQLSTKAARAILDRLTTRYDGRTPTPEQVLAEEPEELRAAAGLSRAKVTFLRSLAEHVIDGSLELERLDELPDDEVIAELVAVKGIGEWSAHVFMMFHLGRPDVLAPGDLGIRRAVMLRYGLPEMPTPAEVGEAGERWRPFRTLACMFLWESLSVMPA